MKVKDNFENPEIYKHTLTVKKKNGLCNSKLKHNRKKGLCVTNEEFIFKLRRLID